MAAISFVFLQASMPVDIFHTLKGMEINNVWWLLGIYAG